MRVIVFFDLPIISSKNKKDYREFRKNLIKLGFMMIQKSVYCKLVPNDSSAKSIIENLKKVKPDEGLVQVVKITEKQYAKMEFIVGECVSEVIDSDERLIII